jgi:hypothetical protein
MPPEIIMRGGQAMAVFREGKRDGLVAFGVTVDCVSRGGKAAPSLTPWQALAPTGYRNQPGQALDGLRLCSARWVPADWETIWNHHPALADAARLDLGPVYDWTSPAFVAVCEGLGLSPLPPPASPPAPLAAWGRVALSRPLRRAGPRPVAPREKISIEEVLRLEKKNAAFGQKLLAAARRVFQG